MELAWEYLPKQKRIVHDQLADSSVGLMRRRVPGGWLVMLIHGESAVHNETALVYVPDPGYTWADIEPHGH